MPFPSFAIIMKWWKWLGCFFFFTLSRHNYNKAGTTSGLVVVLHSWSPRGSSRPFAVVLPLGVCLAESLARYHICCFPSYCSGITSTWTPLRFPKCSEIMRLTNEGLRRHQCSVSASDARLPEWPESFIKSSFNELARLCLSSHFAGGLITSGLLIINEDAAPGRGRSEVISVASDEQKGGDCSDSGVCVGCWMMHTCSIGSVINMTGAAEVESAMGGWWQMSQRQRLKL